MHTVVLSTGSNIGDRENYLESAKKKISEKIGEITKISSVYETAPWGFKSKDNFLNQVLVCKTELEPLELLHQIHDIEKGLGKTETPRYSDEGERLYFSRVIDIDILFYDNHIIENENLIIPHPHICMRDFVIMPLKEILPEFIHPVLNLKIKEL
ncbi:MAG: 2-amino-4-hydroxy-6-hydroxymethyldihydropteridine diphosphokinase [Rikenellaceae bacterium]|nr:2-amino-4-hydroxy-6-hydroxymethyldihydropteridine diphosphokinase [Rikenellaceae bacterium]